MRKGANRSLKGNERRSLSPTHFLFPKDNLNLTNKKLQPAVVALIGAGMLLILSALALLSCQGIRQRHPLKDVIRQN